MFKEKVEALKQAIISNKNEDADQNLWFLEDGINSFGFYVDKVMASESALQIARFRMESDDYRTYGMEIDNSRKRAHDACISVVRLINNLCGLYKVPLVFPGTEKLDRIDLADLVIMPFVAEYFEDRKK